MIRLGSVIGRGKKSCNDYDKWAHRKDTGSRLVRFR